MTKGSIPACAGKPLGTVADPLTIGVHPRVCGEAKVEYSELVEGWGPSPRVRGSHGH